MKAELAAKMEAAAEALEFEKAARFRDRIQAMSFVTQSQDINPQGVDEADVFGLPQEGGTTCVQVYFFRSGQNWGTHAYFPRADKPWKRLRFSRAFWASFMMINPSRS